MRGFLIKAIFIFIVTVFIGVVSWSVNYFRKKQLFESLCQKSFCTRPFTLFEFTDSTHYRITPGNDSLTVMGMGKWSVENNLFGVHLTISSNLFPYRVSSMRLTGLSDSVITFSKGEFEPKFVRFNGDTCLLTEEHWHAQ